MLASAMLRIGTEASEYARGVLHPHVQYYVLRSVEGIFMLMALLRIIVRQRLKFHRQDGALVIIALLRTLDLQKTTSLEHGCFGEYKKGSSTCGPTKFAPMLAVWRDRR